MKDGTKEERAQLQHLHDGGFIAWLPGHAHLIRLLKGADADAIVRVKCDGQVRVNTPNGSKMAWRYEAEQLEVEEARRLPADETDLAEHLAPSSEPAAKPAAKPAKGKKVLAPQDDDVPF